MQERMHGDCVKGGTSWSVPIPVMRSVLNRHKISGEILLDLANLAATTAVLLGCLAFYLPSLRK